jgi:hypothetical protein
MLTNFLPTLSGIEVLRNELLACLRYDLEDAVVAVLIVEESFPAQSLQLHHGNAIVKAG